MVHSKYDNVSVNSIIQLIEAMAYRPFAFVRMMGRGGGGG